MAGGLDAEKRLFAALSARFHMVAANRIWNEEDAKEIVQDALMAVHAKYREASLKSAFTDWAHKVLHNKVLTYYRSTSRKKARFVNTEEMDLYDAQWGTDSELVIRLQECIRKVMTANQRYARVLVQVYHGYSTGDICTRLGLTRANLYSMLSRARSLLRRCLDKGDI